ncbi:MAG: hypothetical protein AAF797_16350 [Planctomycetota bacterium]
MPLGLWLLFALLAFAFARTVLAVIGSRLHIHTARHDLIRETKVKRIEYLHELARREQETLDQHTQAIIEDDDEHEADAGAPEPLATLAPEPESPLQQAA